MYLETTTSAFGRRAVTRAQIEAQIAVAQARARADSGRPAAGQDAAAGQGAGAAHKWTVLRTLSEIRDSLGVSDRSLSVLSALASFHPETALTPDADLVVFPSNKALSLRANGMSEPTLRRHLAALVEAGLIIRRDSPNGKRFARRGEYGGQAYGFDLAPLAARAAEFERRAEELRHEQRRARLLKERINLLRRDLTKRIAFALDEALPGPWEALGRAFLGLCTPLRRLRAMADFTVLAQELDALQRQVTDALTQAIGNAESIGDGAQTERHMTESNSQQVSDSEPASNETGPETAPLPTQTAPAIPELPLKLVVEACPDLADYHFGGVGLTTWRDFTVAAATVRPMLGISPDAWREAVAALGERDAAVALAFILQRCEHSSEAQRHPGPDGKATVTVNGSPAIRSPGGYLRALTQKGRQRTLSLWGAVSWQRRNSPRANGYADGRAPTAARSSR
jgi:replication initiation protein RepC